MQELEALIERLRNEELTLDEFAQAAAARFVYRKKLEYPETDGNEAVLDSISNVTVRTVVRMGTLTEDEAQAIFAALPSTTGV